MITIILGAPGTGKGTISDYLVKNYGFKHVSTGNIFKKIIQSKSPLGQKVKDIIAGGNLVDDQTTAKVLIEGLADYNLKTDKIILDGYPRNIIQADFLKTFLINNDLVLGKVINLVVPEKELIKRLSDRIICPKCGKSYSKTPGVYKPLTEWICDEDGAILVQRPDDLPKNIKVRLKVFYEKTFPVVKYYQDQKNIIDFDADRLSSENIAKEIEKLNESN